MTSPQDKAKELVEKFYQAGSNTQWISKGTAIECAKVAVNEIICTIKKDSDFTTTYDSAKRYWHSVLECLKNY